MCAFFGMPPFCSVSLSTAQHNQVIARRVTYFCFDIIKKKKEFQMECTNDHFFSSLQLSLFLAFLSNCFVADTQQHLLPFRLLVLFSPAFFHFSIVLLLAEKKTLKTGEKCCHLYICCDWTDRHSCECLSSMAANTMTQWFWNFNKLSSHPFLPSFSGK